MATYKDKLDRITSTLTSRTGLRNIVPGSVAGQLSQSVAFEQMNLETKLDNDSIANSILLANGQDLDTIGEGFFGIQRLSEVRTSVTSSMKLIQFYVKSGTFGDINSNRDILVPQGTIIEGNINGSVVRFRLTEDSTLPATSSQVFISAELTQGTNDMLPTGTINKHYFTAYSNAVSNSLLVTNASVIATGRPSESDDNYRYRLTNSLSAFTKTNLDGIMNTILSTVGVSYTYIDQSSNGGGTFTAYVQGMSPVTSDELIIDVAYALSNQLGPWINYNIAKMNYIGLEMNLNIVTSNPSYYTDNTGFVSSLRDTVSTYVNNYFGSTFEILSILNVITNAYPDIISATFNGVNVYTGIGTSREYYTIDFTQDKSPTISIADNEKIIIEQINNPILAQVS